MVRRCASYTFTLYLVHVPVILFAQRHVSIDPDKPSHAALLLLVILVTTVVLGSFTEHKKHLFQRGLGFLFDRVAGLRT